MSLSPFILPYFSLLIVVELKESLGQLTVNEFSEMSSQVSEFESCRSVISDQIRSQNKMLEQLFEAFQKMQEKMENLSREVESKLEASSCPKLGKIERLVSGRIVYVLNPKYVDRYPFKIIVFT